MKHETFVDQAELVSRAQRADDGAFGELVRRTSGASLRVAVGMLKNHHLAEEEVQNAYLNAWRHIRQFQGGSHFSTWMSRIVVNQCLMHLRSFRRAKSMSIDSAPDAQGEPHSRDLADGRANVETRICQQGELAKLGKEISRLPVRLRRALVLRDVQQMTTSEAAQSLGISPAALKSRLLRARMELRRRLAVSPSPGHEAQ